MKLVEAPTPLLIYEALHARKGLSPNEQRRYEQLQRGFIGEKRLEKIIKEGNFENIIPIFDCLFEVNDQEFQVDCILLTTDTLYLLEIKNYTGDYYLENNRIHHLQTKQEIYNPLNQIERTEFLFKKLLDDMKLTVPVSSYIIFINPNFMLYEAPLHQPFIFTSQIHRFLKKINANTYTLSRQSEQIAERIIAQTKEKSTYERLPNYKKQELTPGLYCYHCQSKLVRVGRIYCTCSHCEKNIRMVDAITDAIAQYHLLFPENNITARKINEWIGEEVTPAFMIKILKKHLTLIKKGKLTYYAPNSSWNPSKILSRRYD